METQEVNRSKKLLDGITLWQFCQDEVSASGDAEHERCAKKLELLFLQHGYRGELRIYKRKFLYNIRNFR